MAQYRTQARIIADILVTARDSNTDGVGVGITTLLRRGNVSYSRIVKLVGDLVSSGLLVQMNDKRMAKYIISERGLKFLQVYNQFEDFADSFGLQL